VKVAVLIPLYNHERYILAALASLREQTRPPDRIIIIDDGSTDGSLDRVIGLSGRNAFGARAADATGISPRIEVLSQPNAGAARTINSAATLAADCEYLSILNSDDCYHPHRLENCLDYLLAHPEIDLVCSRLRLIDEAGLPLPPEAPRAHWFSAAWSFRATAGVGDSFDAAEWLGFANFPGTTSNFFVRADYLRAHPLADFRFAHDYHFAVVAALENRLGILDEVLLDYRIHPANTISTEPEQLIREVLRMNAELARSVAPRLAAEPALRASFARYQRATWGNVSAFRADLFNGLLAEALARLPTGAADALLASFDAARYPEIKVFPNKAVVNAHQPSAIAFGAESGLADKFYALKAQLSSVRATARQWAEYRQMQAVLLSSRWFALGRLLGATRPVTEAGGKTGAEKLGIVRARLVNSGWVSLGCKLGIPSARKLRDLSHEEGGAE
jgi:glycosyltransferase involved in cell wall biosynthesis